MGANLPQGKGAERLYTKDEVFVIIKEDRERLSKHVEEELQYGVDDLFEQVPIEIPQ